MVQINFALREVNCKIVYYGPGLSGKTTNLEMIHAKVPQNHRGDLTSIATEGDRTLFFDFMPLELGKVDVLNSRFQLYTVPGQVYYNATRKLVLQGADGLIFVADCQEGKLEENKESLKNLLDNLKEYNLFIEEIPFIMQYNKRDLPNVIPIDVLENELNPRKVPYFESVAITGEGVFPTLKKLANMVLDGLNKEYGVKQPPRRVAAPVATPAAAPRPPAAAAPPPRPAAPAPPRPAAAAPPRPAAAAPPRPAAAAPPRPAQPRPPAAPAAASPQRQSFVPGVTKKAPPPATEKRPRALTIPSEGKGPGWAVAIIFLIIGIVAGIAAEHFLNILSKILSGP